MVSSIFRMILIASAIFIITCTGNVSPVADTNMKSGDGSNSEIDQHDPNLLVANNAKWQEQRIDNYDFDLSASGYFRPFGPTVKISVRNGKLASIENANGKLVRYPRVYEEFSTVDKLFEFLNTVNMRKPEKLVVAYDAERGFPTHVDLDEKEGISDDELTLKVTNFAITYGE